MQDLRTILPDATLEALRGGYTHDAMLAANLAAVSRVAPQLAAWNDAIGSTFYGPDSPLTPRDRERCLIPLIAAIGPGICLAMHVYWGLMEGVGIEEMVHLMGLAGCYSGLPRATFGIDVMHRVLVALSRLSTKSGYGPRDAVESIVQAYAGDQS